MTRTDFNLAIDGHRLPGLCLASAGAGDPVQKLVTACKKRETTVGRSDAPSAAAQAQCGCTEHD